MKNIKQLIESGASAHQIINEASSIGVEITAYTRDDYDEGLDAVEELGGEILDWEAGGNGRDEFYTDCSIPANKKSKLQAMAKKADWDANF